MNTQTVNKKVELPLIENILKLIKSEDKKLTTVNMSGYNVYNKYNKSC